MYYLCAFRKVYSYKYPLNFTDLNYCDHTVYILQTMFDHQRKFSKICPDISQFKWNAHQTFPNTSRQSKLFQIQSVRFLYFYCNHECNYSCIFLNLFKFVVSFLPNSLSSLNPTRRLIFVKSYLSFTGLGASGK